MNISGTYETTDYTMAQLETLMHYNFFRCHRKYLVNLSHITEYDRSKSIIYLNEHLGKNFHLLIGSIIPANMIGILDLLQLNDLITPILGIFVALIYLRLLCRKSFLQTFLLLIIEYLLVVLTEFLLTPIFHITHNSVFQDAIPFIGLSIILILSVLL